MHGLKQRARALACAVGIFATALLSACGGGGDQGRDPILGVPAAPLMTVAVSPATASIAMGGSQQYVATATYADGASRDVTTEATWASATPAVGTIVASTGLARGVSVGTTAISAAFGGRSGSAVLTVTPATLSSMQIAPVNPSVNAGVTQQFTAVGTFSDNTTRDITAISTFTSANTTVATINPSTGLARGLVAGTSVITATSGTRSSSTTLTVTPAVLVSLSMAPVNPTVQVGATQQMTVTGLYSDSTTVNVTASSTYVSATPAVATIGATTGLVTGVTAGSSVVTASFGGMSVQTTVTVPPVTLVSIAVTPPTASIAAGTSQQFTATGTFSNGTTGNITNSVLWTSSNVLVATVIQNGVATGLTIGTTTITATSGAISGSAALTVTAPVLVSLSITPLNPTIQIGASQQLFVSARYSDASVVNVTNLSTYVSATPAVATVGAATGVATGVTAGTSVVTASFGGQNVSTTVTVPAATLTSIAVTPDPASVVVGASQQFTATGTYSNATTGNITNSVVWSSNNLPVATVLPTGFATGFTPGVANITATRGAISGFAVLTVTAPPVVIPPALNTVNLRSADSFAVLAGTALTNNAGGTTFITGDIGSPSQTTDPVQAPGYSNYKSGLPLTNALADLQLAITDANSRTCTVTSAAGIDLGGLVLTPGVYCYAGAISITGTFTMNGPGVYIFRTASTLNTTANATVQLLGGATAQNVFWVPVGATTMGANSVFKGTVMAQSAAITVGDNTTLLDGRVLSAAAVTLQNNQIRK